MTIPITMPQLGESVVKGTIIRWLKAPGDPVEEYEPLVEVETDKVVTEVPASHSGILLEIVLPAGETAEVGAVLAYVGEPGQAVPGDAGRTRATRTSSAETPEMAATAAKPRRFTPVVLRLAETHNISLAELETIGGTGRGGRVSKRDVLRYIEARPQAPGSNSEPIPAAPAPQPQVPSELQPAEPGETAEVAIELTPMRAAIAEHMLRSVQTSAHVTSVFEVDMSRVVVYRRAHREEFARQGLNLAYTVFFVRAAVEALKAQPMANASLVEDKVVLHPQINIGLAVAVEGGLLVPVIKRAEELSLRGLARSIDDLATRARAKKLTPDDVQGGTFTVTNPGMQGALFGTAIIHQPQAAILGVGAIVKRPVVVRGDAIAVRPMVYISLTYDHRLLDGLGANQVLATVRDFLEGY